MLGATGSGICIFRYFDGRPTGLRSAETVQPHKQMVRQVEFNDAASDIEDKKDDSVPTQHNCGDQQRKNRANG